MVAPSQAIAPSKCASNIKQGLHVYLEMRSFVSKGTAATNYWNLFWVSIESVFSIYRYQVMDKKLSLLDGCDKLYFLISQQSPLSCLALNIPRDELLNLVDWLTMICKMRKETSLYFIHDLVPFEM